MLTSCDTPRTDTEGRRGMCETRVLSVQYPEIDIFVSFLFLCGRRCVHAWYRTAQAPKCLKPPSAGRRGVAPRARQRETKCAQTKVLGPGGMGDSIDLDEI